jgi:hypothetical protein
MSENKNQFVIGAFYELPDGRIARTFGWDGKTREAAYYFDTDEPRRSANEEEIAAWVRRDDLTDFPNARDPRVPWNFDLHWDIKHLSELKRALRFGHEDIDEIRAMVVEHNLPIDEALLNPTKMMP